MATTVAIPELCENAAELYRRIDDIIASIPDRFLRKIWLFRNLKSVQARISQIPLQDMAALWNDVARLLNQELPDGEQYDWARRVASILWPPETLIP
jgi:hypothetical protein